MKERINNHLQAPSASSAAHTRRGSRRWGLALAAPIVALLALATGAGEAQAAKTRWSSFRPAKAPDKICIHIGGNDARYYKLDHKSPLEFTLRGPNRIRLITRHLPVEGKIKRQSYIIRVIRDGKEILKKMITSGPSSTAILCGDVDQTVGIGKKSYVTVPSGKHVFRVYVEQKDIPVAVRLFKKETVRDITHVSFTPDEYEGICTLVMSNGKEYPHYHFSRTSPLRFRINGPTTLQIWTRVDFDQTMMTRTSYGLELFQNGESHLVLHYDDVRKLSTASYKEKECQRVLPGERKKIELKVPKGTWTYELRPTSPGPEAITARILIPTKDIANHDSKSKR